MSTMPMDGSTPTERLLESLPDMQLTLDAYHTEVCHLDTPALMRRYAGRVDLVHIKDAQALDPRAPLHPGGRRRDKLPAGVARVRRRGR